MEFWEFLLQKEGDRTWLPLEAAKVEILEGCYRVMAHSSHTNTPIEIRLSQMLLDETPPKRRILKRASYTNQDGLMVVMPFTRLQPGAWELQCIHEPGSKNGWRYSVQLQVLSQEDETSGEWHPSWEDAKEVDAATNAFLTLKDPGDASNQNSGHQPPPPASGLGDLPKSAAVGATLTSETANPETANPEAANPETANIAPMMNPNGGEETPPSEGVTEVLKLADQLSRQIVDSLFKEIEHTLADAALNTSTEPTSTPPADDFTSATIPSCKLDLSQSAFMTQPDRSLAVAGHIVSDQTATISDTRLPASELRIHLRNPHNSEVLLEQTYPLQDTVLPADFSLDLELPSPLPTRLMLGEITLSLPQPNASAALWASQSFTITAPINELLEAIANEAEAQSDLGYVPLSPETEQSLDETPQADEAFPSRPNDFPRPSAKGSKNVFQPLSKQLLPPQLHQPNPESTAARPLILPSFPTLSQPLEAKQSQSADGVRLSEVNQLLDKSLADRLGAIEESALGSDDFQPDPDELTARQAENIVFDPLDAELAAATIQAMGEEADTLSSRAALPIDIAFQALNLQERFWSRLNALTTEGRQEAAEFRSAVEAAGVRMGSTDTVEAELDARESWLHQALAVGVTVNAHQHLAEEIVVYEDPVEATPIKSVTAAESVEANAGSRDNTESVTPTPVLKIPAVELTAGEMIAIDVSLPMLESRTYVKLWISDRQTRALLDKPRWLMDLQSNGDGELVSTLRLKVPHGCTEARFTAIAVNMVTQQESYKAIVERTVFPPDLPPLSLDEFEV
ncbi:MAG: hypothetical protein MJA27_28500 [Pseudanabaenales cyanobacterium]|nr:hypothetical protein [Pseudanabaenales cyanobacterium]